MLLAIAVVLVSAPTKNAFAQQTVNGSNVVVGPSGNINDTTGVTSTLQFGNYTANGFVTSSADAYIYKTSNVFAGLSAQTLIFQTRSDTTGGGFAFVGGSSPSPLVYINGSGNVGVGTTSPSFKFEVSQADLEHPLFLTSVGQVGLNLINNGAHANDWSILTFARAGNQSVSAAIGAQFTSTSTTAPTTDLVFGTGNAVGVQERMRLTGAGNVGIGATNPIYKLHVATPTGTTAVGIEFNSATEQGLQIVNKNTPNTSTPPYVWSLGPGIGNAPPDFGIYNVSNGTLGLTVFANGSVNASNLLSSSGHLGLPANVGGIVYATGGYSSPDSGRFIFGDGSGWRVHFSKRSGNGDPVDVVTIQDNGNVNISGTVNAKYQDVAEWVPSSEQLSTGTVVVLDPTKSNQVTSSTTSYDTRVAGVVSEQPGIALGEKSDSKVLVATTGRVRVNVDATKSPIHVGDLLVTSDIPGVAMKSEPVNLGGVQLHRPGTLIGKALEPLEKGKGEILVLLSLQ